MQPRIKHPALTIPGTREALLTISKATEACGVPPATLELVHLRVAQINGCSVCVDMHARALEKLGEKSPRIFALGAWRETSYYSEPERAALALAEAATRLSDRPDPVREGVWKEASRPFPDAELAALVLTIASANLWNRLSVPTRQVTGDWVAQYI